MMKSSEETEAILLVDDNPTNLQLLFETLDGRGYKLLVANSLVLNPARSGSFCGP